MADFSLREGKEADLILLAGGTANLPGLKEYVAEVLRKKVEVPNCFSDILYPPILSEILLKMAPSFAVATGAAIGGLETQN